VKNRVVFTLMLLAACLAGGAIERSFNSEVPLPESVVLEVTEPVVVKMYSPPQIPVDCARCSCDPDWHSVNLQRAWRRFDTASIEMENKVDLLFVGALNCDTATRGWASAMSHWESACRGDERACL
jgi:hypothetical protein